MPFPALNLRRFTAPEIERVPPGRSGVYGIYNASAWFIIEGCDDVRDRLIDHWELENPALDDFGPTGFYFEFSDSPTVRAAELCAEYMVRLGPSVGLGNRSA